MAMFRVGQRVRLVRGIEACDWPSGYVSCGAEQMAPTPIGAEGVVGSGPRWSDAFIFVVWDDYPSPHSSRGWNVMPYQLAPLTDPRAADFVADMERFASVAKGRALQLAAKAEAA